MKTLPNLAEAEEGAAIARQSVRVKHVKHTARTRSDQLKFDS